MNYLGIDVGGTSIKGAIVNEKGKIGEIFSLPIFKNEKQNDAINRLIVSCKEYLKNTKTKIKGIGIGIPGTLNTKDGVVDYTSNLKWKKLHIVDMFSKEFDCPIKITNDANAAALGEAKFGAGKKYKNIVMITLGTGIGGGVIIDGKLFEGYLGKGTELGHTTLVYNGRKCGCGRRGCFEQYASASALVRYTKEAMKEDKNSLMWQISKEEGEVNGKVAFFAAQKGDSSAKAVVKQYVEYLSEGLLNICNVFRPEAIVLSGGIANQGKYLTDKIKAYCEKYEYGYKYSPKTVIKVAELGYVSGIIGAACLLMK